MSHAEYLLPKVQRMLIKLIKASDELLSELQEADLYINEESNEPYQDCGNLTAVLQEIVDSRYCPYNGPLYSLKRTKENK